MSIEVFLVFCVFFSLHSSCTESRLGVHKKLGGDTTRTADRNWPKGYFLPNDIVISSKSLGKRRRKRGHSRLWHLFSQVTGVCAEALLPREVAGHLPANGKQRINSLFCFPCMHSFTSLIKLSLAQSILIFLFWFPLPSCQGHSEQAAVWVPSCWLGQPTTAG